MWRRCDLHIHLGQDDARSPRFSVGDAVQAAMEAGLDIVSITEHDVIADIKDPFDKNGSRGLVVLPGVEITTTFGHVLAHAPSEDGCDTLRSLLARTGGGPGKQVKFEELVNVVQTEVAPNGVPYSDAVVLIAAHAETSGSLLAGDQAGPHAERVGRALDTDAIEVKEDDVRDSWLRQGVASSGNAMPILQGSDAHEISRIGSRSFWIYLEDLSLEGLLQAFATFEASIAFGDDRPKEVSQWIKSIRISDGLHAGLELQFSQRINAVIGPPSIGKSLLVDALRFVFNDVCDIDEVSELTRRRCDRVLPEGTIVELVLSVDGEDVAIQREVGGEMSPEVPFHPIIFSQTELTRRAMDRTPALQLIDVHADGLGDSYEQHRTLAKDIGDRLIRTRQVAGSVRDLRAAVLNPVDGLDATVEKIQNLGASEDHARRAQSIESVLVWREKARKALAGLRPAELDIPRLPRTPSLPEQDTELIDRYVPRTRLKQGMDGLAQQLDVVASNLRTNLTDQLGGDDDLLSEREAVDAELVAAAGDDADDLLKKLKDYRSRRAELEAMAEELKDAEADLESHLSELAAVFEKLAKADEAITLARTDACRDVNAMMRGFFCKCVKTNTSGLVGVLAELRTGLHKPTLEKVVSETPPVELVERVVRMIADGTDPAAQRDNTDDAVDRIAVRLAEDASGSSLTSVTTQRVEETLGIFRKSEGKPQAFGELTEGLRALAIKEISFVSSRRPVVSDQPEDSVPTRSVFEELVPTFQRQRATRQFIVVSHDANIVVGGDTDRVIVIGPEAATSIGTLFSQTISREALDNLEGGEEAFRRRGRRYSRGRDVPSS